jgi:hypothetical protein
LFIHTVGQSDCRTIGLSDYRSDLKKNSPLEVGNYRPISILSIVSKILERSVYKQLANWTLSVRYDSNQSTDCTLMTFSLLHKILWSTVSTAFCRSNIIIPVYRPLAFLWMYHVGCPRIVYWSPCFFFYLCQWYVNKYRWRL